MEYGTWNMEYGIVSECQISDKIVEFGPNQVYMAPFGMIRYQNPSHMVCDASGTPPGFQIPPKNKKTKKSGK